MFGYYRMMMIQYKLCKGCKTHKPKSLFRFNVDRRYRAGGYHHARCRECENATRRK